MDDLLQALHLAKSAAACLEDAVARRDKAETALPQKADAFATLSDDAALSAAWRLADCGLILRRILESKGLQAVGLTERTGRGALLPDLPA